MMQSWVIGVSVPPATFEAETLVVEQSSEAGELVNGSVLVPANRTGVTPDTVMRLSCTVANQGRFQWEWTVPDTISTPSQLLLDATRTSVIEVPQSRMSVGEYTCTASYHSDTGLVSSGATTFTVEPECEPHSFCVYIVCPGLNVIIKHVSSLHLPQWCCTLLSGVSV